MISYILSCERLSEFVNIHVYSEQIGIVLSRYICAATKSKSVLKSIWLCKTRIVESHTARSSSSKNGRESGRRNQEWTIQRNWQH